MIKNSVKSFLVAIIIICYILSGFSSDVSANPSSQTIISQDTQLHIYTYDSLLAEPFYDIKGNFTEYSGIVDIKITKFPDANSILTTLMLDKAEGRNEADVVIGIDNALIHSIENISELLEPYTPTNISQINDTLIENLDPDHYLIPYDFGIIALWYQNQVVNSTTNPELINLTLETLLESDLLSMLIVENPKLSSPGLGFLLWTIAVYGDPLINFKGLLDDDWRNWWDKSKSDIIITKSWGDAWTLFSETSEEKPIMVSYGTSPAYGFCQWADNTSSAVVTHENDTKNAWLQIEGIGLVKNAPHKDNAKEFIDWFLGEELQSELPEHQWMYPANTEVNVSNCFKEASIAPSEVNPLNSLLPPAMLKKYLTQWQDQWEQVVVKKSIPGFDIPIAISSILVIAFYAILVGRKKKKSS